MIITAYNSPIEITEKNIRAFNKMHNTDIDSTDIEMYLDAYYHMEPQMLVNKFSTQDLSTTVNNSIQNEAINCYSLDFYRKA